MSHPIYEAADLLTAACLRDYRRDMLDPENKSVFHMEPKEDIKVRKKMVKAIDLVLTYCETQK